MIWFMPWWGWLLLILFLFSGVRIYTTEEKKKPEKKKTQSKPFSNIEGDEIPGSWDIQPLFVTDGDESNIVEGTITNIIESDTTE